MKTSPRIKAIALIVSLILLIPISINWYSFLARTISDDNETPDTSLEYTVLTDSNTTFMLLFDSTVVIGKCSLSQTRNISIPEKVCTRGKEYTITSIGNKAFSYCHELTNIEIPESVESIGKYAFERCSSLKNIVIPANVTEIGDFTFLGCSSLENIVIPATVESIGKYAFAGCSSLENFVIPESVNSIGESAFNICSNLKNIKIPESVNSIGESAFHNCSSLINIKIPKSVNSIGNYAFEGTVKTAFQFINFLTEDFLLKRCQTFLKKCRPVSESLDPASPVFS